MSFEINAGCSIAIVAMALILATSALAVETGPTNSGTVTLHITLDAPESANKARMWIPYPISDESQKIDAVTVTGNFNQKEITSDPATGDKTLYLEWTGPMKEQRLAELTFHASAKERKGAPAPTAETAIPEEILAFTKASALIPTDGEIGKIATGAVEGKASIAKKHEAIFGWVVENTFRDPNVMGCGTGIVERTLASRGGKCVDISTVYVSLARAAGIPAREVFGMRLGTDKGASDVTGGHHCWAEYYQPGAGWTPTDPADVRKIMLVKKLTLEEAAGPRAFYQSAVDADRVALGRAGRGVTLNPPQEGGALNYFMYPYAEIDGKPVEWLAAQKELKYKITYVRD